MIVVVGDLPNSERASRLPRWFYPIAVIEVAYFIVCEALWGPLVGLAYFSISIAALVVILLPLGLVNGIRRNR
jgi:hypothetical protein